MDTIMGRDAQGVVHEVTPLGSPAAPSTGSPDHTSPSWSDRLAAAAHGIEHGASFVYHHILAIEQDVRNWESGNPQVVAFLRTGVQLGMAAIDRTGFPVGSVSIVATDILAAVKAMAAMDPSVDGVNAPATAERQQPQQIEQPVLELHPNSGPSAAPPPPPPPPTPQPPATEGNATPPPPPPQEGVS